MVFSEIKDFTGLGNAKSLDDEGNSAHESDFVITIYPVAGFSGTTKVKLEFSDYEKDGAVGLDPAKITSSTFVEFQVTLNQVDVEHNGWKNLKVLGPRVGGSGFCEPSLPINNSGVYSNQVESLKKEDCVGYGGIWRPGELVDEPYVCSYSQTLCNGGAACVGTNQEAVTADEFNAIYKNTSSNTCYAAKTQKSFGELVIKSKKAGGTFIYVESVDDSENTRLVSHKVVGSGEYNHTNFIHLKLSTSTTYDELMDAMIGADREDDMICGGGDVSCLVQLEVPDISSSTQNFNPTTDMPQGLYYLGVKDAYTHHADGVLVVTYQEGTIFEITDNDGSPPQASYDQNEKKLTIKSDHLIVENTDVTKICRFEFS